jgi:biotin transport system substrate-specific component
MTILIHSEDRSTSSASLPLRNLLSVVAASILIGLCAPIAIPLPFSPVPIALQPHVCLFLGAFLGSKRGALAVLAFLMQGALGLPVFANGASGILWLFGPTGGYLMGYLVGAFLTGYLIERKKGECTMKRVFLAMAAGNIAIFILGWLQLSRFIGPGTAFTVGVLPFLLGDFLKLSLAGRVLRDPRLRS